MKQRRKKERSRKMRRMVKTRKWKDLELTVLDEEGRVQGMDKDPKIRVDGIIVVGVE